MKRVPKRTCIGCLAKKSYQELKRLVLKKGKVVFDAANKLSGRGAYLCRKGQKVKPECLKLALEKNAFEKAFRKKEIDCQAIRTSQAASGGGAGPH